MQERATPTLQGWQPLAMNTPAMNTASSSVALDDDVSKARPRPAPLRWLGTALLVVFALQFVVFLVTNPRFEWPVVWKYLFAPSILEGLGMTVVLTVIGMAAGIVIGTITALTLMSNWRPGQLAAHAYLWAFRGTPLLIQLIFWYNLAYLMPTLSIGLPFMEPFYTVEANTVITPFVAAFLGLGLAEGAYMTEIVRAGLLSVDPRQHDAARAIGMTPVKSFFRIVLPQAMRFIIPPTGNQVIGMAKATALVSVIAMNDLLHSAQLIYNRTYEIVPLLLVAVFWYLVLITLLYALQGRLERHYSRGHRRAGSNGSTIANAKPAVAK
jgi:polar amino acid transport system permease protein